MKNKPYFHILLAMFLLIACEKKDGNLNLPGKGASADGRDTGVLSIDSPVIVILGASTAYGTGSSPIDSSWVNRLRLTTAQNPKPLTYINLALGGYTTYQAMPTGFVSPIPNRPAPDPKRNITKAISLHPDLVMITFPSHDVNQGFTGDEVINNYARIISLLDSAKVPYILFGTQPKNFTELSKRQELKSINDRIRAIYGERSNDYFDQISTADLKIKPEYAYGDGTHLNNKGHKLIMNTVLNHAIFQKVIQ
ncbi:Lysophospholipase L1 [Pedobacter westerhofensis]|uniref:Lysophospholipase L1 n=1 Tax=Pedobacter westerhofensis TaxID=425512 RepID=A0A521E7T9_9SPHI|nr:SGNH/GDSL hydrolase family protein [Pedobacter westerhofensis]SMO79957.1 Lysophospholipase L1 [Pedobacter westerhofensis]